MLVFVIVDVVVVVICVVSEVVIMAVLVGGRVSCGGCCVSSVNDKLKGSGTGGFMQLPGCQENSTVFRCFPVFSSCVRRPCNFNIFQSVKSQLLMYNVQTITSLNQFKMEFWYYRMREHDRMKVLKFHYPTLGLHVSFRIGESTERGKSFKCI